MRNLKKVKKIQSFFSDKGEVIDTFDHASDAMRICQAKYESKGFDNKWICRCCNDKQSHSGKIDGRKVGWKKAEVEQ